MTYNELNKETKLKLPDFSVYWLTLVLKKSKKEIYNMQMEDIFNAGSAGRQALRELTILLKKESGYENIKAYFKEKNISMPVLKRVEVTPKSEGKENVS